MRLTDDEQRIPQGEEGPAVQAAMELVRYGEVLGAKRLVETCPVGRAAPATVASGAGTAGWPSPAGLKGCVMAAGPACRRFLR